jgi:hypothetical protein
MKHIILFTLLSALMLIGCDCKKHPPDPPPTTKHPPTVADLSFSNVTTTSFVVSSSVTSSLTLSSITLYYDTTSPCDGKNPTDLGTNAGVVTKLVSNLRSGKLYYACIIAVNADGSVRKQGSVQTLTPIINPPTITTTSATNITNTSFTLTATINSDGGEPVSTAKFLVATHANPTQADEIVTANIAGNTFSANVSSRTPGTKYYFKAFATNSAGTGTGNEMNATTTGYHVGQDLGYALVYKITTDGNHCWFVAKTDTASGVGSGINAGYAWDGLAPNNPSCNTNFTDGKTNTQNIMSTIASPTSARSAYMFTAGGMVGTNTFWLPAKDELFELWQICHNNSSLSTITWSGDPTWHKYWSSSQGSSAILAYCTDGNNGGSATDGKNTGGAVKSIGYQ